MSRKTFNFSKLKVVKLRIQLKKEGKRRKTAEVIEDSIETQLSS